jgi:hypothetical protein
MVSVFAPWPPAPVTPVVFFASINTDSRAAGQAFGVNYCLG